MSGGIDDGYSDGVEPFSIGYDPGQGDESAFIVVGGENLDVVTMGPGDYEVAMAQIAAMNEVAMAETVLPYHLSGLAAAGVERTLPRKRYKTAKRCSLPGCQNATSHRGGYCCADHCREHRRMQGKHVKAVGR